MRIFEVPEGSRTSKGRAIQNLMNIESDDKVMAYIPVLDIKDPEYVNAHNVVMCTKKGGHQKDHFGGVLTSANQWHQCHHHQRGR